MDPLVREQGDILLPCQEKSERPGKATVIKSLSRMMKITARWPFCGVGWQERLCHGREQENWTYAINLGKVLDRLNLKLLGEE